ncbi:hypothetical protein, partial [Gluconobacter albidus]
AHIEEAEARGAEEARRVDAVASLRPMSEAKKDRSPILAKIHDDLFPRLRPERADLKPWNGRWVVVSHPGIPEDGFDIGWGVAAPVGYGGLPDDWFVGWKPIECPANVAALEARVKVLEKEQPDAVWAVLTGNTSSDPKLPSCRLSRLFQEGDTFPRFKQAAEEFGIEVILKSDEREEEDWDKELSAEILARFDQRGDLIADGWSFVDVWDDEDGNIIRLFARPIRAALTREGGE